MHLNNLLSAILSVEVSSNQATLQFSNGDDTCLSKPDYEIKYIVLSNLALDSFYLNGNGVGAGAPNIGQNYWKIMQNTEISLKFNEFYWNFSIVWFQPNFNVD